MPEYKDAAERFQRDTAGHEMTIVHDDGLHRHLQFKAPGASFYGFELVTWPGSLAIRGGMDGFMFSRIMDMFEFFRGKRINPDYWAEKTEGGRDSCKRYSQEKFCQVVKERFVEEVRDGGTPRGLGKAVRAEILNSDEIGWEDDARRVLDEFEYGALFKVSCLCGDAAEFAEEYGASLWRSSHIRSSSAVHHRSSVERVEGFRFDDTWDWDFREYTAQFLWCCHAIVWGIRQYDKARVPAHREGGGSDA